MFQNPLRDGLMLELFNPKSYPVMVSVLSSVAAQYDGLMEWEFAPSIFGFALLGFIAGKAFIVLIGTIPVVRNLFTSHMRILSGLFGLIFCFFGFSLLYSLF